ncbi:MAG: murein peptide amidase A, partial [Gammaproteobacteria bacterium]
MPVLRIILIACLLPAIAPAEEIVDVVRQECQRIGGKLGSVSVRDCLKIKLNDSGGRSNKNAAILLKEYPPLPARTPLGKVLLVGGI